VVTEGLKPSEANRLQTFDKDDKQQKSFKPSDGTTEKLLLNQDANTKESNFTDDLFKVEQGADYLSGNGNRDEKERERAFYEYFCY